VCKIPTFHSDAPFSPSATNPSPPPFSAMNSTPGHSKASNDPRPHAIADAGQAALSNGLRGEACTVEDIETRD
jgi:hypothetical protein